MEKFIQNIGDAESARTAYLLVDNQPAVNKAFWGLIYQPFEAVVGQPTKEEVKEAKGDSKKALKIKARNYANISLSYLWVWASTDRYDKGFVPEKGTEATHAAELAAFTQMCEDKTFDILAEGCSKAAMAQTILDELQLGGLELTEANSKAETKKILDAVAKIIADQQEQPVTIEKLEGLATTLETDLTRDEKGELPEMGALLLADLGLRALVDPAAVADAVAEATGIPVAEIPTAETPVIVEPAAPVAESLATPEAPVQSDVVVAGSTDYSPLLKIVGMFAKTAERTFKSQAQMLKLMSEASEAQAVEFGEMREQIEAMQQALPASSVTAPALAAPVLEEVPA